MYFFIDRENKNRLLTYTDVKPMGETEDVTPDFIECDHFAPFDFSFPAWDYDKQDWVESITNEELEIGKQQPTSPDKSREEILTETVNFLGLQIAEMKMNGGGN